MTEMGDLFNAVLKHQEKTDKNGKKKKTYLFENTPEDRIRFEIRKIAVDLGKLLSGNRKKKAFLFLCSELLSGNLKSFFTDPEVLGNMLEKIRHRDFSLFYREVLFKNPIGSEFIQKEVIPNFVFLSISRVQSCYVAGDGRIPQRQSRASVLSALFYRETEGNSPDPAGLFPLGITENSGRL